MTVGLSGSVMLLTTEIANAVNNWKPRKMIIPNGKSVFITGCDTGFGHMLAKELDKEGFEVFAGCLFPDGDGAKELKKSTSNSVHIIPLDVTSDDSIFKAYQYVARNLNEKGLWAVVNNAGINDGGELLWTKMDVIEKVLQVNTLGVIKVTKMFLTLLCQSKGRLVTVASMGGRKALPLMAPYCASKYAVIGFCESLRQEMHPFGVKVVTVEPFGYRTVLADETKVTADLQRAWDSASPEVRDLFPKDYFETVKSCDTGFGNMLAKALYKEGFKVFAGCLFPDGDGSKELKKFGSSALHVVPLDVTSEDSILKALQYVARNLSENGLWAVVNNAGINEGGELLWTNTDIFEKVFQINILGVIKVTNMFLPLLCQSEGRLIAVASALGRTSVPTMSAYCASKHAIIGFCDSLRQEMYQFGVKVVTIEPFGFRTAITDENKVKADFQRAWDSSSPEVRKLFPEDYFETNMKQVAPKINRLFKSDNLQEIINCLKTAVMVENPKLSYQPGSLRARVVFYFLSRIPKPYLDFFTLMN